MSRRQWNDLMEGNEDPCDNKLLNSLCCTSGNDISHLHKVGVVKDTPQGGSTIESSREVRFKLPKIHDDIPSFGKESQVWLNV